MLNQSRANQIADDIARQVSNTAARPDSIEALAKRVIEAIQEYDVSIASALEQRHRIVELIEPFIPLYQSVAKKRLIDALPGLTQLSEDPTDLIARRLTQETLKIADEMWNDRGTTEDLVALGEVVQELKNYAAEEDIKIPWSNPAAVVSTILTRSGRWERETARQYRRINDPWTNNMFGLHQ
jgi:hypothetical protein